MKMPLFLKKSIYAKMPMFFGGGPTPDFKPAVPFKSAFENPELLPLPDTELPKKPSWMNTYQPEDNISDPSTQPFPVNDTPRSQSGSFKPYEEKKKPDTMGTLRDGMYVGNALLRGLSEGNANRQMEEYEQMNIANPLANMAYNDGRTEDVTYGYEQFMRGGMIKRADGSYSKRGLWDNIRANKGSGNKPTKEMLEQERKINSKEQGGFYQKMGKRK